MHVDMKCQAETATSICVTYYMYFI